MNEDKVQIKLPQVGGEVSATDVKKRLDKIDAILITIVVAVVLALISIIISVTGIFIDQLRYNNAAYKEYSQKLDIQKELEEKNNKIKSEIETSQAEIIKQQEELKELISNIK